MKKYIFLLLVPVILGSCTNWLEVKPNDRISEDATFSTPQGFELALNGVYVDLNKSNLYGQALTWDFVEIMAQRYAIPSTSTYNIEAMLFHSNAEEVKVRVSRIWQQAYSLIANINLILKNCEEHREVISDEYYRLIKGEALGLRALLHFDLFRLWGPVYTAEAEEKESIPYYTHFALVAQPKLSAKAFMTQVTDDLKEAAGLLEEDPIKTAASPLKADVANPFFGYRALRMNYYAVRLLAARAYLYMNDRENAYQAAKEVVDVQEALFPWTNNEQLAMQDNPDRMFSSELVFALQNSKRKSVFTDHFDTDNLKLGTLLVPLQTVIEERIFNEFDDIRYKMWLSDNVTIEGGSYKKFLKYQAIADTLYNQLIPMLRVSEAYYIVAECEGAKDESAGLAWLNKVRNARSLESQRWSMYYERTLESEYMREFFGEGQLFFFYKRRNSEFMPYAYDPELDLKVEASDYVLRIPDEESKYN